MWPRSIPGKRTGAAIVSIAKKQDLSPAHLRTVQRQERALSLRRQGAPWSQVAAQMKAFAEQGTIGPVPQRYGVGAAKRDVEAAMARSAMVADDEASIERFIQTEQLDKLLPVYFPRALRGDLKALDRVLSIFDQKAKLIPGVYPPPNAACRGASPNGDDGATDAHVGPVVVKIEWPDPPQGNDLGVAEPGDPATDVEITKMLKGALGPDVGGEVAEAVCGVLAQIAHRKRAGDTRSDGRL
jgi:hypothetical protein